MLTDPPNWNELITVSDPEFANSFLGHHVVPTEFENAIDFDVILVGEPYDGGHIFGRPGTRQGPSALRQALANTLSHCSDGSSIELSIGDIGDTEIERGQSNRAIVEQIRTVAQAVHAVSTIPIFLGGDHSLTYPNVEPLLNMHDSVGVLNFDAHDDLMDPIDNQPHTGSPFKQLYESGLDEYVIIGARRFGLGNVQYLEEQDGTVISAEAVGADPKEAVDQARSAVSDVDALYLTVDVDVLDMAFAPGTSSPSPGGLLPRELFQLLRSLAMDDRIVGFDIVECSPPLESEKTSAVVGGRAIAHLLSGLQKSRK